MRIQNLVVAAAMAFALPAFAHEGVAVLDAYARTTGGAGTNGAVFMVLDNHVDRDDRLIAAASDVAEKVELHTHVMSAEGMMQMIPAEGGFAIPPLGQHALARGGDHVMLIGLVRDLADGDIITLTLTFEVSGDMVVEVAVDNARMDAGGGHGHGHGTMEHGMGYGDPPAAMVDTTGLSDPKAITAIMKAQFETPENPLTVEPVVVEGDHALAGWAQGNKGGRALLERREGQWVIVLCGGDDLRLPSFLAQQGVTAAETLSRLYNATEDGLGPDKVVLYSSFEGVLMVDGPAN